MINEIPHSNDPVALDTAFSVEENERRAFQRRRKMKVGMVPFITVTMCN